MRNIDGIRRWRATLSVQDSTTAMLPVHCIQGDHRQTPVCPEQPGQGHLSMCRMCRHLPTALVFLLAAAGHVQGCTDDLQCALHSNAGVTQQSTAYHPHASMGLYDHPRLRRWLSPGLAQTWFNVPSVWLPVNSSHGQLVTRSCRHLVNSSQVKLSVMFSLQSQLITMPLYTTVNVT